MPLRRLLLAVLAISLLGPSIVSARTRHHSEPLVVVLDPGHGGQMHYGDESGAVSPDGILLEKNMTLAVAKLAARDLQTMGYRVFLTRTRDEHVNMPPRDLNHDGKIDHVDEYNARTLFANRHHADVFVSIHFDGSNDPTISGTHGYWCPARPFWRSNQRLATLLTAGVVRSLQHAGYTDSNNGVQTDVADVVPQSRADYPWFLVLGPSRHHWLTGSAMPGALIETLYMSSPRDDHAMRNPVMVAAMAQGYANGIHAYFNGHATR